ncbi:MAG: hypothetical protein PVI90_00950 [Desulfobacteraceae bacterium]|jgi:hypothetical protein
MPFKSTSQRRLFYAKAHRGEIPMSTVREWEAATPKNKKLPEHVKKAEPGLPKGISLEKWDKILQKGPKKNKSDYYITGTKQALAQIGLI